MSGDESDREERMRRTAPIEPHPPGSSEGDDGDENRGGLDVDEFDRREARQGARRKPAGPPKLPRDDEERAADEGDEERSGPPDVPPTDPT